MGIRGLLKTALAGTVALVAFAGAAAIAQDKPVVGLITKTEGNPFFVKMREGAQQAGHFEAAKPEREALADSLSSLTLCETCGVAVGSGGGKECTERSRTRRSPLDFGSQRME